MESSTSSGPLVKCPFCQKQVESKKLADHAKYSHASDTRFTKKSKSRKASLLEGIEVQSSDLVRDFNQLVVDESGVLTNPRLLEEGEHHKTRDERLGTVSLPKSAKVKRRNKPKKVKPDIRSSSVDDAYRERVEWLEKIEAPNRPANSIELANTDAQGGLITCAICRLQVKPAKFRTHLAKAHSSIYPPNKQTPKILKRLISRIRRQASKKAGLVGPEQSQINALEAFLQSLDEKTEERLDKISTRMESTNSGQQVDLVKCPLCKHRTQYKVLFVHIQVSHPEVNPKIVMAKFNRVNSNKDHGNLSKYQDELNELVKDYERLKQGQDEPRDGGKYMGHMRREHGKFGSLPLYDDYSDESDAE